MAEADAPEVAMEFTPVGVAAAAAVMEMFPVLPLGAAVVAMMAWALRPAVPIEFEFERVTPPLLPFCA